MQNAHAKTVEDCADELVVTVNEGLSSADAERRIDRYGRNELPPDERTPLWKLWIRQFDDTLVKILLVAAAVSLALALADGEAAEAFVEPAVIGLILLANAAVGVVLESGAEESIEGLKAYQAEKATTKRDSAWLSVESERLVPGDIINLTTGSKVPADCRLCDQISDMEVDQSILTGESGSVAKTTEADSARAVYQDMHCMLFSGTVVTHGSGNAIVIGTGTKTALGRIRDSLAESMEEATPLKRKLDAFGTFLSKVIFFVCVLVWVINIGRFNDARFGGFVRGAIYYFKLAISLAVAAIPEGLPAVVTTCLALGTRRMAKRSAVVRSLPSVETLGGTSVICADKTGTLTTNAMAVTRVALLKRGGAEVWRHTVESRGYDPRNCAIWHEREDGSRRHHEGKGSQGMRLVAMACTLCNDAILSLKRSKGRGETVEAIGEPTEAALRTLVEKIGVQEEDRAHRSSGEGWNDRARRHWESQMRFVSNVDFDRRRKMKSSMWNDGEQSWLFVKGAPESVISRCAEVVDWTDGSVSNFSSRDADAATERTLNELWHEGMRVIALAFKRLPGEQKSASVDDEANLTLLGLLGVSDPPRREAKAAIEECHAAGIRVIMCTGDAKLAAESIAKQVGLTRNTNAGTPAGKGKNTKDRVTRLEAMTGKEFEDLSHAARLSACDNAKVLSRVEPKHKTELVSQLKKHGHVVAMTGDGVNDAPALKAADIGIAMGSGTAVARNAADLILSDDNFNTIVAAVEEGRSIYQNTKQFIRYMISSNIGEVVCILLGTSLRLPEILLPVQLLWVNFVTDGLPATALGFNEADAELMHSKPRDLQAPVVDTAMLVRYLAVGIYIGISTVSGYVWWFLSFDGGPRMSWRMLTSAEECGIEGASAECEAIKDRRPMTVAMTVLVVIEMLNAFNALSETKSLASVPPWSNIYLVVAVALSMVLHVCIIYIRPFALAFQLAPLSAKEWAVSVCLSLPVIALEEALKLHARLRKERRSGRF